MSTDDLPPNQRGSTSSAAAGETPAEAVTVPATGAGAHPAPAAPDPGASELPSDNSTHLYRSVQESPDFARLRHSLRRFVFPVTAAFLIWYSLYVLLSAFARGLMGTRVIGNINVALVFGLLQFVSTFLIAWYYARYMDRRFDPLAIEIRTRVEKGVDR